MDYSATFLSWCASQALSLQLLLLLPLLLFIEQAPQFKGGGDLKKNPLLGQVHLGVTFVSEAIEATHVH